MAESVLCSPSTSEGLHPSNLPAFRFAQTLFFTMKTAISYPAIFAGLTLDGINEHLRQGLATEADATQLVTWWNESGKRFTVATLRKRAVVIGRTECLAPYITIAD